MEQYRTIIIRLWGKIPLNDTFLRKAEDYGDTLYRNELSTVLCKLEPLYDCWRNLLISNLHISLCICQETIKNYNFSDVF